MSNRRKRTSDLTRAVIDLCTVYGGYAFRTSNQPRIDRKTGKAFFPDKRSVGMPDILAFMPHGVVLAIEVKVSPDKIRPTQQAFAAELAKRDHNYILVSDTIDILRGVLYYGKKITKKEEK